MSTSEKRTMVFHKIIYDTQYSDGSNRLTFFSGTDDNAQSVTEWSEADVVKWLFEHTSFRSLLFETIGRNMETSKIFYEVKEPFVIHDRKSGKLSKPGDIDLLMVDSSHPDKTVAFECKRIKSLSIDETNAKVNNLNSIKKGCTQARFYKALGFHQTYLMVILVDDGRNYNTPNVVMRNTELKHLDDLYNIPRQESLDENVGIIFIKVEQTTGKHINLTGNFAVCIDRMAKCFDQSQDVTNKINDLLISHNLKKII